MSATVSSKKGAKGSTETGRPSGTGRGFHALAPLAWRVLLSGVVIFAMYVAAGRLLMSQVSQWREPLLAQVNQRLPFDIEVTSLQGNWLGFSPELTFTDLQLLPAESAGGVIALGSGSLRLDVAKTLATQSLQLSHLQISDLNLNARLSESGRIELEGFSAGGEGEALRNWLEDFLPNVERVALFDNRLCLMTASGDLELMLDLVLERDGNARRLQGTIGGSELAAAINAEGVGNPLRPLDWTGDVYLDIRSRDLSAFAALWRTLDWPFDLSGDAHAEFWLSRDDRDSTARMRWSGTALQVDEASGAWSLPLDALSFEAALDQRDRHWSLLTEDFHIERLGQALDLDRVQFDWWGQALRVRATDLGLSALPTLLAAAPGLPERLREIMPELAPQGRVAVAELRLDDLAQPVQSWSVRASLDDLEISSWRQTPALTGVTGYLSLLPGEGSLQLDSKAFSMHYPSVYKEPLRYDEALGEVRLRWDALGLHIDSGLMELANAGGQARGLFAVDVPFDGRDTGIELELLIGLLDAPLGQSARYLPYTLPQSLLDWLDRSVLDGHARSAGLVWRGSVKRDYPAHRTVQLFVDADQASLRFDPEWPALTDLEAMLWIDDRQTWARGVRASSGDARLDKLMVGVTPKGNTARINVQAGIDSDAATAGQLLRDTPLRALTSDVFVDWEFAGRVNGDLALELVVGDSEAAPQVDLNLNLVDVSAQVAQVDLPMSGINGQFIFANEKGFAGSTIRLDTLGVTFSVDAMPDAPEGFALAIEGDLVAGSVAEWLGLPLLEFANGSAPLSGELVIAGETQSYLLLNSDLEGVALDAPHPFGKSPAQPLPLVVRVPLSSDPDIKLALGERLNLQLRMRDSRLHQLAAAVGGEAPDLAACDQQYCLAGSISSLDIAAWSKFYQDYVVVNEESATSDASETAAKITATADSAIRPDSYRIDSLHVGELRLATRSLGMSRVDLWGVDMLWQGSLESASAQGSLTREDGDLQLLIEHLDLSQFSGGEPTKLADIRGLIPNMRVDVLDLRRDDQQLGSVGFDLDMSHPDGSLTASAISGELYGVDLDAQRAGMLRWSDTDGEEQTALELDGRFGDLGGVIEAAGYAPTLESERGELSLRLEWPGPPSVYTASTMSGSVDISARNGRILEARPGALAMISFLNLAEILRGLSLAHMFDAGIPFMTASAEMYLHAGTLEIADLQIDGAASAFAFNGLSDLLAGSINGELVVTLPVANNLPWVAALAAGLPVAAGVFVVSKVFEKQVNRMSSAVYGVSGDIDAPKVEFRRLFDDQLKSSAPMAADAPAAMVEDPSEDPASSETGGD
ncbi:MAG: AsmA2 domain-containing protein YhdP [Congregibacter sp.]